MTLASLLAIDRNPIRAYEHISAKSNFFQSYILGFRPMEEAKGDHSMLQSMKTVMRIVHHHGFSFDRGEYTGYYNDALSWNIYRAYLVLAVVIGLVTLWKTWDKPVLNQMLAVTCITAVLPMFAADYTLMVLVIPMGFFLIYLLQEVAEGRAPMTMGGCWCSCCRSRGPLRRSHL